MPSKSAVRGTKRKSPALDASPIASPTPKKPKNEAATASTPAIVDRRYYPAEMSIERCYAYSDNDIPRPIAKLESALTETKAVRDKIKAGAAVVHWFKNDLRLQDNKSLHAASRKAHLEGKSLVALYIASPQDWEAHITSPVRVDFMLRTLEVLKSDLAALGIPLYMETVDKRKEVPERVLELCKEWKANHIFTNMEYEVDELRREVKLVKLGLDHGIAVEVLHDTCVVPPGELQTGTGKQYAVYTPWYRSWLAFLKAQPEFLDLYDPPTKNPEKTRKEYKSLFECRIPDAPKSKELSPEEKKRFANLWPAGEHEASRRLDKFLKEKVGQYSDMRNFPAEIATSVISPHLAAGSLSARATVRAAQDANSTRKLDGGNSGITVWISELAWRDFYKHVMAHWPYICMNKCFKPEYLDIEWEYNMQHFEAWKAGRTGYPIVDAAMRQLQHTGWMHNRCRMIVASFLSKHLLLDWRLGEQYFMSVLVDGDFASNHGGWGFGSSTGVDPQPYFRIFNPLLQSEKFDAHGSYLRKWVPELAALDDKTIHAPWERGGKAVASKAGYPKPIVEHRFARERCLQRYKAGLGRETT